MSYSFHLGLKFQFSLTSPFPSLPFFLTEAIRNKRRLQYEGDLKDNPHNYDVWFDYIRLEEATADNHPNTREVYERAIANRPPVEEKKYWRR